MDAASRGEMPKNAGLNLSISLEEAAPPRVHLAGRVRVGIEVGVDVPAVLGHLGDRVAAAREQIPERAGPSAPGKRHAMPTTAMGALFCAPEPQPWPAGRGFPAAPLRSRAGWSKDFAWFMSCSQALTC